MSESVTLDAIADREIEIWGVPRKGQRTLFTTAISSLIEKKKQDIERDNWVAEAIAIRSDRSKAECKPLAEAVKDYLADENLSGIRDRRDVIDQRYFDIMNERRAIQAAKLSVDD